MQAKLTQSLRRLYPHLSPEKTGSIAKQAIETVDKCAGVEYAYRLASAAIRGVW